MRLSIILMILVVILGVATVSNTYALYHMNARLNNFIAGGSNNRPAANIANNDIAQAQAARIAASTDDDEVLGNKNAPVTIIEFSDFQCPYCAKFYLETFPEIYENYIKTGKARFVYRDFPLSFHPNAQKAAEAAECAGNQDKFWEMSDKIFKNQKALDNDNLKVYAKEIGLNEDAFGKCLDKGEAANEVKKDFEEGAKYGVQGTPAFFINGISVSGAQPYSVFEKIIEEELN